MSDKKANYYPPTAFHFAVHFNFEQGEENKDEQHFQSVSGLTVDVETEEITEGGENRFKHKVPVRTKYPNLVLKRGMLFDSQVIEWCKQAVFNANYAPIDLTINLLAIPEKADLENPTTKVLQTWSIVHAYPIKWSVADFNAEESKVLIETLELTYNYFKIV